MYWRRSEAKDSFILLGPKTIFSWHLLSLISPSPRCPLQIANSTVIHIRSHSAFPATVHVSYRSFPHAIIILMQYLMRLSVFVHFCYLIIMQRSLINEIFYREQIVIEIRHYLDRFLVFSFSFTFLVRDSKRKIRNYASANIALFNEIPPSAATMWPTRISDWVRLARKRMICKFSWDLQNSSVITFPMSSGVPIRPSGRLLPTPANNYNGSIWSELNYLFWAVEPCPAPPSFLQKQRPHLWPPGPDCNTKFIEFPHLIFDS